MGDDIRFQTVETAPAWAQPLLKDMEAHGCFGDPRHLDLSWDMLRCMELMHRYWKKLNG